MESSNKIKHVSLLLSALFSMLQVNAQVGFNNPNPAPSSLIDMTANDKGLLVPRMTTIDRTNMISKNPAHALLVFDKDQNMFFVYDTIANPDRWVAINPFQTSGTNGNITTPITGNVGIGTDNPTSKLEVNGTVSAQNYGLNATGNGPVPKGGIIMWSGNPNAIPAGWALCDGSVVAGTKTPNLSGRFIAGYDKNDADYNLQVDSVGPKYSDADGISNGKNSVDAKQIKLTSAQSGSPAHNHTGYTSTDGDHKHLFQTSGDKGGDGVGQVRVIASNSDFVAPPNQGYDADMKANGSHNHSLTINYSTNTNASVAFENRPPFYVLAYIIKL